MCIIFELMNITAKYLVVADAGNTSIKFAVFMNGFIQDVFRIKYLELEKWLLEQQSWKSYECILASVVGDEIKNVLEKNFQTVHEISLLHKLPFNNLYQSPTIGLDRICNAAAIAMIAPQKNAVAIDIGTCIKFDFVDSDGNYHGGSISPGINLRYKSLNDYTEKLPLLNDKSKACLIGNSTHDSIHSVVINGIQAELNDLIQQYQNKIHDLTFFVTGGDANRFDFSRKNNIFANENLTLTGLYYVYLQNVQKEHHTFIDPL